MPMSRPSALAEKRRSDSERWRSGSTNEPGSILRVLQSMRAATSGGSRSMRKAAAAAGLERPARKRRSWAWNGSSSSMGVRGG